MSEDNTQNIENAEEEIQIEGTIDDKVKVVPDAQVKENHVPKIDIPADMSNDQLLDTIIGSDTLIPWEQCELPSRGLYYNWPDGYVKVRAMTQTAEKMLANQRLAKSGQALDAMLAECCQLPNGFTLADLLVGDRIFLMYYIRGITYGNIYEFSVTCPDCGVSNMHSYDLNNLSETITFADSEIGNEPFKVHLPYMSEAVNKDVWVGLRFLRVFDTNEILARRKARSKAFSTTTVRNKKPGTNKSRSQPNNDDMIEEHMSKIIVSFMGVEDPFRIRQLVDKLHAKDTHTIREWLKDHTPGISSAVDVTCPECGFDFSMELPITDTFFRPAER